MRKITIALVAMAIMTSPAFAGDRGHGRGHHGGHGGGPTYNQGGSGGVAIANPYVYSNTSSNANAYGSGFGQGGNGGNAQGGAATINNNGGGPFSSGTSIGGSTVAAYCSEGFNIGGVAGVFGLNLGQHDVAAICKTSMALEQMRLYAATHPMGWNAPYGRYCVIIQAYQHTVEQLFGGNKRPGKMIDCDTPPRQQVAAPAPIAVTPVATAAPSFVRNPGEDTSSCLGRYYGMPGANPAGARSACGN